jgi:hypothetical protein
VIAVHLEPWELALAAKVGVARRAYAIAAGMRERDPGFIGRVWDANIEGAAGEIAFAKATDRYWDAYVGPVSPHRPDVGRYEVRTRSFADGLLTIKPGTADDVPFVLMRGRAPDFELVGWTPAGEGMRAGTRTYLGGSPAIEVPLAILRPPEELVR